MKNHGKLECGESRPEAHSATFGRTKHEFAPDSVQNPCRRPALDEIALVRVSAAASVGTDALRMMSWFGRRPSARDVAMKEGG